MVTEVSTFFANRAAEQTRAEQAAIAAGVQYEDAAKTILKRDKDGNLVAVANSGAQPFIDTAANARSNYGSGSAARIIGTAISGAAGGNVTGSLGSFVQAAAVNALQAFATTRVKAIADTFLRNGVPTVESEAVRTALQALVGCAGAAPTGNCASGALGASSSVVLNNLITSLLQPEQRDAAGNIIPRSLADQQTRTALIATLTGAIAGALGANAGVASNAGVIETENNALARQAQPRPTPLESAGFSSCAYTPSCASANGFARVNPDELRLPPGILEQTNGLRAAIFRRGDTVVVAFAGTNELINDGVDNVQAALGITSAQYEAAATIARRISLAVGNGKLEFTGHSLGGGLAAVAAAVTGRRAITFNAAPLGRATANLYNITSATSNRITNIYVRGDTVSALGALPALTTVGRQRPIGTVVGRLLTFNPVGQYVAGLHSINTIIALLQR